MNSINKAPVYQIIKGVMNWLFKIIYIVVRGQLMTFAWFLHSKTSKLISNMMTS